MPDVSRRRCSKPSCAQPAVSTLTYVYADSTAVVGPLATYAEPHCYDLCQMHTDRLTAPRGWEIVRITPDPDALKPTTDDLEALANAVREAAKPRFDPGAGEEPQAQPASASVTSRRGHLRVVPEVSPMASAPSRQETVTDPYHPVHATPATERDSESHPPQTRDEPFDHERLW